ncbi:MAG: hypothetical protein CMD35_02645 [Flavobacteriales bacterium]|nr:hypothetical protein [Flavobacteriales bacterium]
MDKLPVFCSLETIFIFRVEGIFSSFSNLVFIGIVVLFTIDEEGVVFLRPQIDGMGSVILRGFFFYSL